MNVKSFDAFPKVEDYRSVDRAPRSRELILSRFMMLIGMFFLYLETTRWMGAHEDFEFSVDKGLQETFQVNLDISVASECRVLDIFIVDATDDRLMVSTLVDMEDYEQIGKKWCRMTGIFNTNRVGGKLVIGSKGGGFFAHPVYPVDLSHVIHELSFGEFYPNIVNPLDHTLKIAQETNEYFGYYLKIVPATFKALGMSVDTYIYTVNEAAHTKKRQVRSPAIFFHWDFDPIYITVKDSRMGFFQWLFRIANIVGGVMAVTSWFSRYLKGQNDDKGLLDQSLDSA